VITLFCDFRPFSAKKIGAFLKNQCYDHIFSKSSTGFEQKKPPIFKPNFWRIKKTQNFGPRSIYRQNLNSDFTDSALGSSEKSPMPYGNFHLRESTVQSILANPKYGPKSELGTNMYTYLKFGLPRVLPPRPHSGSGGAREQVTEINFSLHIF
jgi:hypothetical protein